jgi:hypothetical protein
MPQLPVLNFGYQAASYPNAPTLAAPTPNVKHRDWNMPEGEQDISAMGMYIPAPTDTPSREEYDAQVREGLPTVQFSDPRSAQIADLGWAHTGTRDEVEGDVTAYYDSVRRMLISQLVESYGQPITGFSQLEVTPQYVGDTRYSTRPTDVLGPGQAKPPSPPPPGWNKIPKLKGVIALWLAWTGAQKAHTGKPGTKLWAYDTMEKAKRRWSTNQMAESEKVQLAEAFMRQGYPEEAAAVLFAIEKGYPALLSAAELAKNLGLSPEYTSIAADIPADVANWLRQFTRIGPPIVEPGTAEIGIVPGITVPTPWKPINQLQGLVGFGDTVTDLLSSPTAIAYLAPFTPYLFKPGVYIPSVMKVLRPDVSIHHLQGYLAPEVLHDIKEAVGIPVTKQLTDQELQLFINRMYEEANQIRKSDDPEALVFALRKLAEQKATEIGLLDPGEGGGLPEVPLDPLAPPPGAPGPYPKVEITTSPWPSAGWPDGPPDGGSTSGATRQYCITNIERWVAKHGWDVYPDIPPECMDIYQSLKRGESPTTDRQQRRDRNGDSETPTGRRTGRTAPRYQRPT